MFARNWRLMFELISDVQMEKYAGEMYAFDQLIPQLITKVYVHLANSVYLLSIFHIAIKLFTPT